MSLPGDEDPLSDLETAPNRFGTADCETRTGEAPCGAVEASFDPEFTQEELELARHGLLSELTRRRFLQATSAFAASFGLTAHAIAEQQEASATVPVTLKVNGKSQALSLDPRTSLLD